MSERLVVCVGNLMFWKNSVLDRQNVNTDTHLPHMYMHVNTRMQANKQINKQTTIPIHLCTNITQHAHLGKYCCIIFHSKYGHVILSTESINVYFNQQH